MKLNIKNIRLKSICVTLFISLFLSCNNGIEELQKRNNFLSSLANLGNDFLSVFTSFGDMTGTVLRFNTTTKKSDVGDYFKKVKETVEGVKSKLNTIVENMKSANNPNASTTGSAVNSLVTNILDKIIEGAKTISDAIGSDDKPIANVADQDAGAAGAEVDSLVKGIKNIVNVVLKEGNADAGDENGPVQDSNGTAGSTRSSGGGGTHGDARKLFAKDKAGNDAGDAAKAAKDASKAVGAVTGADILQAIAKNSDSAKLATGTDGSAIKNPKDATIAGAIALRAMAKKGKFSNKSDGDAVVKKAVEDATISAVTKALETLTIAIRKTIDEGLREIKEAMKINPEANPVTSETGVAAK
ncbi:variable large family protein (plasmid) [Borrelia coriaceae]|uniref:Variable large protein n=1 Tax=Borrelia coriaceae ATCC 43381 TaxID=1408429 RepID=W5SX30_9SPIR|nr:variable large family protein [Borrelia coriaceae]AHH11455.1 Variable outer membrane protein [Borrelia coriaceae ATCC 43381]UPA17286.1 variable large family protein [Borrelia coriaceae]